MFVENPRAFIVTFLTSVVLFAVATIAFNVIVDPFWRFDLVTRDGLNAQRPQFTTLGRLGKPGVVCRMQPAKVILGTSRAELGLDPRHPAFSATPGTTYNLALAGSGIHEVLVTLRHAKYASPELRQVVVAVDFLMFNAHREATVFGTEVPFFDPDRLLAGPEDSCWRNLAYDFSYLLWAKGLRHSVTTVAQQMTTDLDKQRNFARWINLYDELGYRGDYFADRSFQPGANPVQPFTVSLQGAGQEHAYAERIWRPAPSHRYCLAVPGQTDTIETFRQIVRFGHSNGLDVRFVINPIHARMIFAIYDIGLWPTYEAWKRQLVETIETEAQRAGAPAFPLWDFSGINATTSEDVATEDDQRSLPWFWEPSHYTATVGNMMLDKVLDPVGPARRGPTDFGIRLDASSIDGWTQETRHRLRGYMKSHPEEIRIVRDALAPLMAASAGSNCGHAIDALATGSEALQRGDKAAAEAAFARALAIHDADRRRYAEIGAPFRETGFERALEEARKGEIIRGPSGRFAGLPTKPQ